MIVDLELDDWRREWSRDTEPLPELKQRVRRQDRRLRWGLVALAVMLVAGMVLALSFATSGWWGFATGLWASVLVVGGYVLWTRRGMWEPSAQTSLAYADLIHRRAVAEVRKMVFLRRTLAVVILGYAAFVFFRLPHRGVREVLLLSGLAIEVLWIRVLEARRRRAVTDAARLLASTRAADTTATERMDHS